MDSLVVSAFPGVGKTYFYEKIKQRFSVSDSDSSKFPKEDFPQNYLAHIQKMMDQKDIVLVSSHAEIRTAMRQVGIEYLLVYPDKELKDDYLQRYKDRGSPDAFIKLMDDNWFSFIKTLQQDPSRKKVVLTKGLYLSDMIKEFTKNVL